MNTKFSLGNAGKIVLGMVIFLCAGILHAQSTFTPFMGIGNVQVWDNNGSPCTGCALYTYQAGTTTQLPTYTDTTGTVVNPDPVTFGAGARANIWLQSASYYKIVLCLQNDGPSCAPGDVLFSVDQVPGLTGGGGSTGSPFTGTFISGTTTPATAGILRLASGDQLCFRNQANSGNICFSKDTNDLLTWSGGSIRLPEISAPSGCSSGYAILWNDSSTNGWKYCANGSSPQALAVGGTDINGSGTPPTQVTCMHWGVNGQQTCFSAGGITGSQYLKWNGSNIIGQTLTPTGSEADYVTAAGSGTTGNCAKWIATGGIGDSGHSCTGVDQFANSTSTCTTGSAAGSTCTLTVNWPVSFADTSYYTMCTLNSLTGFPTLQGVATQSAGGVTLTVENGASNEAVASTAGAMCHGHHN